MKRRPLELSSDLRLDESATRVVSVPIDRPTTDEGSTDHFDDALANVDRPNFFERARELLRTERISWLADHRLIRVLGVGGQGIVFLSERGGADDFLVPVALKFFSTACFDNIADYEKDMLRISRIAARVSLIQHDNLLDVQNFVEHDGERVMVSEWVDGYDLRNLLSLETLEKARRHVPPPRWEYINDVVITSGPMRGRLKPGIAVHILRECVAALHALHRNGIVHGDIKPANIMLKRTGATKVIDMGAAVDVADTEARRLFSPAYAAPEILAGQRPTPQSDLASLGYVLVEMLSGNLVFAHCRTIADLVEAKCQLSNRLGSILPDGVVKNRLLLELCQRLIAAGPDERFPDAESVDLAKDGAFAFHRQLVKGDLASEYSTDIRNWIEVLPAS